MASLPLDAKAADQLPAGRWRISTTVSTFNVWSGSWHTGTIHRELGRQGEPLRDDELRLLEQRHPKDEIYRADLEGWRADLELALGFPGSLVVSLRLPRYGIGTPHWDGVAHGFHRALGLTPGDEEWFARGQTVVYIRGTGGSLERWGELETEGWGDVALSVAGSGGRWAAAEHRWVLALEAPLGDRETLGGSGGWDAGVRWFANWGRERHRGRVGVGYTWLDREGSFLGIRRTDTWHLSGEVLWPLSRRIDVATGARFDGSPLADLTGLDPGEPSFFVTLGLRAGLAESRWLALHLGENYPIKGVAPDFTFHLQVGTTVGGERR